MSKSLRVNQTARCSNCEEYSVGSPQTVVEKEEKLYTLYLCEKCGSYWHRSHQPVTQSKLQ